MKNIISLIIIILIFASCKNNQRLNFALEFADKNRFELEQAMEHYENDPEKLKALIFLIENMPKYYSYSDPRLDSLKSIKSQICTQGYINQSDIDNWYRVDYRTFEKKFDAHIITADYLITNIDFAFEQWKLPWNKNLSFEDFCEYILPYRIADEPLENWKEKYATHFKKRLDSLYTGSDLIEVASHLVQLLKDDGFKHNEQLNLPHLGANFLFDFKTGTCQESCDYTVYVFRALGLPCGIDFYRYAPDYRNGHQWNFLRDESGRDIPFWFISSNFNKDQKPDRKMGKAYRNCYGLQPLICSTILDDKSVPYFFRSGYVKDVTANYFGENKLSVLLDSHSDENYLYLSVFGRNGYIPIDIAEIIDREAIFNNLESDVFYQPIYINSKGQEMATYPFMLADSGTHYFVPELENLQSVELLRKYPLRKLMSKFLNESVGSEFYAGLCRTSAEMFKIGELPDTIVTNLIPFDFDSDIRCRFIKMVVPRDQFLVIAEMMFYGSDNAILPYTVSTSCDNPDVNNDITKVCDNNILTYYQSNHKSEGDVEVIFDFGDVVKLRRLVYIPRNDDNFVSEGDDYELFYHSGRSGFVSLGVKIADSDRVLKYDNVPLNSLLWLKNLTKGSEEQLFYISDGKQMFPPRLH